MTSGSNALEETASLTAAVRRFVGELAGAGLIGCARRIEARVACPRGKSSDALGDGDALLIKSWPERPSPPMALMWCETKELAERVELCAYDSAGRALMQRTYGMRAPGVVLCGTSAA